MEAISLLGYSRSFLPCHTKDIVRFGEDQLQVFAEVQRKKSIEKIGFGYHQKKGKTLRLNGEKAKPDEIVQQLPLVILSPRSFDILEGPAIERRRRIDWGVFHVKPAFKSEWRKYKKILMQRNAALKEAQTSRDILVWSLALAESAKKILFIRNEYVETIEPLFFKHLRLLGFDKDLVLSQNVGWSQNTSLEEQLEQGFESDKRVGQTQKGAHKYDLRFHIEGHKAKHVLSRGEKKRLLCALLFAQMERLEHFGERAVIILDDITSELDDEAIQSFIDRAASLGEQVFITSVDDSARVQQKIPQSSKKFHVKQGKITESQ